MKSMEEARAHLLSLARRLPSEQVQVASAVGRVVAEDVRAPVSLPGFEASAMDGFAVNSSEFGVRRVFSVSLESRAGDPPKSLPRGTVARIFTGAPVPAGADAVVMQEVVSLDAEVATFQDAPKPGAWIRHAGEDVSQGVVAIRAGERFGLAHVGLASALGLQAIPVSRRPRVTVACLGDELRLPGESLDPGAIYEANGPMLRALGEASGAEVTVLPLLRDDPDVLAAAFRAALPACDLFVTVGGASVGTHDLARPALEAAGATLDFWKVDLRPGKPVAVGTCGDAVVLVLPGNPAAAFVTFTVFGVPLLRAMQGDARPVPPFVRLPLRAAFERKGDRPELFRAVIEHVDGREGVRVFGQQSSGALSSLAAADALVLAPKPRVKFEIGEEVEVLRLRGA